MSLLTDKWWDLVKFTSLRLFHFIDYEMNYAIEIPWRLWDEEKLCYFVKQMDIRNKNPYLFRALAFDRLLKNVLFVLRNHIYIYVCSRIDPFLLDRSSLCTFFVCDSYVAQRSLISNPIANGIIDWSCHTEKRSYVRIWFPSFPVFLTIP